MSNDLNTPRLPARKTTYNGIAMRSRLEARYAAWLDKQNVRWEYEPRAYGTAEGQYLPDFRLHDIIILGAPAVLYVDTKPTIDTTEATLERMKIIHASEPDVWLGVETPDLMRDAATIAVAAPPCIGGLHIMFTWARVAPDWKPTLVRDMTLGRWSAT